MVTKDINSFIERFGEMKERKIFLECVDDLTYNILSTNPNITKLRLRDISIVLKQRIGIVNGTMKMAKTYGSNRMKSFKKAFYHVVGIPSRSSVSIDGPMLLTLSKNRNLRKAMLKEMKK